MEEKATFGSGCFWCTEAVFRRVKGVKKVVSGYSGGTTTNPTYGQVCQGTTGHAEVVQIVFDPMVVSYRQILEIFFGTHDPTTLNRQGNDTGTQYRSVIFFHTKRQQEEALSVKKSLEDDRVFAGPIVTEIVVFKDFYPAENYHRQYYEQNGGEPYCRAVISPKIAKFRERFASLLTNDA